MSSYDDDDKDLSWKKPDWTTNTKLRSTGMADVVKKGGNLAAPITNLPHQMDDGPFSKPEWTDVVKPEERQLEENLAKPITTLPHTDGGNDLSFKKPDWTKNPVLKESGKGEALKQGKEIARPIGGIKAVDN